MYLVLARFSNYNKALNELKNSLFTINLVVSTEQMRCPAPALMDQRKWQIPGASSQGTSVKNRDAPDWRTCDQRNNRKLLAICQHHRTHVSGGSKGTGVDFSYCTNAPLMN